MNTIGDVIPVDNTDGDVNTIGDAIPVDNTDSSKIVVQNSTSVNTIGDAIPVDNTDSSKIVVQNSTSANTVRNTGHRPNYGNSGKFNPDINRSHSFKNNFRARNYVFK